MLEMRTDKSFIKRRFLVIFTFLYLIKFSYLQNVPAAQCECARYGFYRRQSYLKRNHLDISNLNISRLGIYHVALVRWGSIGYQICTRWYSWVLIYHVTQHGNQNLIEDLSSDLSQILISYIHFIRSSYRVENYSMSKIKFRLYCLMILKIWYVVINVWFSTSSYVSFTIIHLNILSSREGLPIFNYTRYPVAWF